MSELEFEQAKLSFLSGLESLHGGRFAEAEQHFQASLAAVPGRVSTLINLAATELFLDKPEEALAHADAALAAEPDGAEAWLHRASALLQLGRLAEALRGFDRLIELDEAHVEGRLRRAQTLGRLGRPADALADFQRVLQVVPAHAEAWSGSGSMLRELQRFAEAAQAFREAIRLGGRSDLLAYYLASVEGRDSPATAPRDYVQHLFDDYADAFDAHLVGTLRYRAHTQLVDGLMRCAAGPYRSAIDLGCGTGLCGPLVRPLARTLTGLDLSPRMLDKARQLAVYDHLEQADAAEFLGTTESRFDLVLAADVFIYIGDLAPIFAAVSRAMTRGVFCFSLEVLDTEADAFKVLASLRYAHSEAYVRRVAAAHGFAPIAWQRAQVREEQRHAVDGLFVYLAKA